VARHDGGRYLDTFCGAITADKVTGRYNIGIYRGMIADRDKIAKLMVPRQGWGGHFQECTRADAGRRGLRVAPGGNGSCRRAFASGTHLAPGRGGLRRRAHR
jgi:UbiD family decarboxylase